MKKKSRERDVQEGHTLEDLIIPRACLNQHQVSLLVANCHILFPVFYWVYQAYTPEGIAETKVIQFACESCQKTSKECDFMICPLDLVYYDYETAFFPNKKMRKA